MLQEFQWTVICSNVSYCTLYQVGRQILLVTLTQISYAQSFVFVVNLTLVLIRLSYATKHQELWLKLHHNN